MADPILPQIKTIVFLMLENRSLDNLLGWLYEGSAPQHLYPADSLPPNYNGLRKGAFSNPYLTASGKLEHYPVVPVPDGLGKNQDRVPAYDPTEEMYLSTSWNGVLNQLFGDEKRIKNAPSPPTDARMLGFYQDYYAWYMHGWQGMDILWTYTPKQAQVINWLAKTYAVSDAWFCSVPTQTNPNRAYSIIGTSQGRENNQSLSAVEQYNRTTIFNALATAKKSWGLYYTNEWHAPKGSSKKQCFTQYTFPELSKAGGEIATMKQFFTRAQAGTLPNFTYLEPEWGYGKGTAFVQGTDYHPPSHIQPGEDFLLKVYQALRNSTKWEETLFIVTFDEHGGTYDHVAPPWGALNPDGINGKYFKFNLFGARVPTILISPFVKSSTVFRAKLEGHFPFDHTSFIKFLLLWAGVDLGTVDFGKRMPMAPTFEGVFDANPVNDAQFDLQRPPAPEPVGGMDVPDGGGAPLNALFEGIPFASVRAIMNASNSLAEIMEGIAAYRADPEKFEASLGN